MEIPEILEPLKFRRTNQKVLERLVKTIPFEPQKLEIEFYADKGAIPDYEARFSNGSGRRIDNRTDDKNLFTEGRPQMINISYQELSSREEKVYSFEDIYEKLIPLAFKNKYKVKKAHFNWNYQFGRTYLARERKKRNIAIPFGGSEEGKLLKKEFSVNVRVFAFAQNRAGLEVESQIGHLYDIKDGRFSASGKDEKCEFLSFIKERDKDEIILLRNWFEYLIDFAYGQRYFVENPFPAGSCLSGRKYQWFWGRGYY